MSATPDDFLKFAKSVAASSQEIDLRNAASRAYYAAFHCCNLCRQWGQNAADAAAKGSHDRLYARLKNVQGNDEISKLLKGMAFLALEMKEVRVAADYALDMDFDIHTTKQQLKDAEKVLAKFRRLSEL